MWSSTSPSMASFQNNARVRGRFFAAAFAFALVLACLALQGCVSNDDTLMPWASPAPGEGNMLPSTLIRE